MKLRADNITTQLAKGLAPVYLVTGDEELLVGEVVDSIRAEARKQGFDERESHTAEARSNWAELLGGWLRAEPGVESGFSVTAFLPYGKPAA